VSPGDENLPFFGLIFVFKPCDLLPGFKNGSIILSMNENDLKIVEIRVKNLMLSKQLIVQTLTVIIGGMIGLGFMPDNMLKWPLLFAGSLFVIIFLKNFYDVRSEIIKNLYKK